MVAHVVTIREMATIEYPSENDLKVELDNLLVHANGGAESKHETAMVYARLWLPMSLQPFSPPLTPKPKLQLAVPRKLG